MKRALNRQQERYNISLRNVFDTGINSIEKALEVWNRVCVEFDEPKLGKDGHYFLGRKIMLIEPNSDSKCQNLSIKMIILKYFIILT